MGLGLCDGKGKIKVTLRSSSAASHQRLLAAVMCHAFASACAILLLIIWLSNFPSQIGQQNFIALLQFSLLAGPLAYHKRDILPRFSISPMLYMECIDK
jgi:hypothetical protein